VMMTLVCVAVSMLVVGYFSGRREVAPTERRWPSEYGGS
jgi:hypothetical protein